MNYHDFYKSVNIPTPELDGCEFIPSVYDYFEKEYKSCKDVYNNFIANKDLGLQAIVSKENEHNYGRGIHSDYYRVIDKKKWMLSRLKYGI
jgi:hypothetical protein